MSLIEHLSGKAALMRLQGLDSSAVKNAFFANYLSALMLVKLKDIHGLVLVNDPAHKTLGSFSGRMSDLCFWGRALFHPEDEQVKDALKYGHADLLHKEAGRILDSRVHKIIGAVMEPPEQINWNEVVASLFLLRHRFGVSSSYFSRITGAFAKWDKLTDAQRDKAVYDCFMYLLQSDNHSGLISRMRELTGKSVLVGAAELARKVTNIARIPEPRNGIYEDDAGGGVSVSAGGGTSAANIGTTNGAVNFSSGNSIIDQLSSDSCDALKPYIFGPKKKKVGNKENLKYEKFRRRERRFKLIKFKAPSSKIRNLANA